MLMVSALDSGWSGPGLIPGQGHCLVFLGKTLTLTVPLSTEVYKLFLANLMLGVTLRWTSIPSRGSTNSPSRSNWDKLRLHGPLGSHVDCTLLFTD